jgi:hypothetical protein
MGEHYPLLPVGVITIPLTNVGSLFQIRNGFYAVIRSGFGESRRRRSLLSVLPQGLISFQNILPKKSKIVCSHSLNARLKKPYRVIIFRGQTISDFLWSGFAQNISK